MPRGYWLFFATAFGWLVLVGAEVPPQPKGQPETKQTADSQSPAKALGAVVERTTKRNEKPSGQQEDDRQSELRAAWVAAEASRDSADWAFIGLWLTGLSILGLLVTLGFNWAAWRQARAQEADTLRALNAADKSADAATKLAETAEINAKKELRAYLDFDGVALRRWPKMQSAPGCVFARHKIKLKNYGKTQAENVAITVDTIAVIKATGEKGPMVAPEGEQVVACIAPSGSFHRRGFIDVPEGTMAAFERDEWRCHTKIFVTYTDVFGDRHVLRSEFESLGAASDFGFVAGTRVST